MYSVSHTVMPDPQRGNAARSSRSPAEHRLDPALPPQIQPSASSGPNRAPSLNLRKRLLKGVSMEIVSKLLGHSSIKVTERHYSPWVKARQDQLETEVRRIWSISDAATV
jgi:integrase